MRLQQNIWSRYGLKCSPFDTRPLSLEQNDLPITKAYVGRDENSRENILLTNILCSPGGCRFVVEGDVGVGKTSFVNYHRQLWEKEAIDKILTTEREISVYSTWTVKDFLLNILSAVLDKLKKIPVAQDHLKKDEVLKEIVLLSKVYRGKTRGYGVNAFNFGFSTEKNENVNIPPIPEVQLMNYFHYLVEKVKEFGFVGLFLHLDNLELIKNYYEITQVQTLFENLRDALQTPNVYFAFVSYKGFFQEVIAPRERLRSVFFGRPIHIPPLKRLEVVEAITKRYELLKDSTSSTFVPPFENNFIGYLYDSYRGKMRFIMEAASTLVPFLKKDSPKTLSTNEARLKLKEILYEEIMDKVTPQEWEILKVAVKSEYFTNKDIVTQLKISAPNVTRTLKKLIEKQLISQVHKESKYVYYQVFEDIRIILDSESLQQIQPYRKTTLMNQRIEKGIKIISKMKTFTTKEYSCELKVSTATARNDIKQLIKLGKIVKKGKTKNTYFIYVGRVIN